MPNCLPSKRVVQTVHKSPIGVFSKQRSKGNFRINNTASKKFSFHKCLSYLQSLSSFFINWQVPRNPVVLFLFSKVNMRSITHLKSSVSCPLRGTSLVRLPPQPYPVKQVLAISHSLCIQNCLYFPFQFQPQVEVFKIVPRHLVITKSIRIYVERNVRVTSPVCLRAELYGCDVERGM